MKFSTIFEKWAFFGHNKSADQDEASKCCETSEPLRDFKLPPQSRRDLRSSGMLRSVRRDKSAPTFSGQPVSVETSSFKKSKKDLAFLNLEDGTQ